MRILCVGCYANGNVGDSHQADAVAALVHEALPGAAVFSLTTDTRRMAPYPALNQTVAAGSLRDPQLVNSFDVMVVGGGGLLATGHPPLNDAEWVSSITIPMVGLGLGADPTFAKEAEAFIARCFAFSVRDDYSRDAVRPFRQGPVEIVMDPILLSPDSGPVRRDAVTDGICLVPGRLLEGTLPFYRHYLETIWRPEVDSVVSVNPVTDRKSGFDELFGPLVRYVGSIEEFNAAIADKAMVASERFHGCIMAMRAGVPSVGIALRSQTVTSKITEMYRLLGASSAIVGKTERPDRQTLLDRSRGTDRLPFRRERGAAVSFLQGALNGVFARP